MEIDDVIKSVQKLLFDKFQIKVIAICKGGPIEPLVRPEQQPYIIFEHTEKSLKRMIKIMEAIQINTVRINEFLKSSFDKKTLTLRWVFMPPPSLLRFTSKDDRDIFWKRLLIILNQIEYE